MARREILDIVGLLGLMMIKLDCGEASTRPRLAGAHSAHLKTPFYFNELNDHVNEKI
jgi:hypothetical protein